jgi:hypothetical protein
MAACGKVELRNKNDKYIAADLNAKNLYIEPKNIGKTTRQQIIKGSEWELRCCLNDSLSLHFDRVWTQLSRGMMSRSRGASAKLGPEPAKMQCIAVFLNHDMAEFCLSL